MHSLKIVLFNMPSIALLSFTLLFTSITHAEDFNTRDIDLYKAKKIDANTLSAGQPSEKVLVQLADKGLVKVINLRPKDEFDEFDEAKLVESLAMDYQTLPIASAADINFENAAKLDAMLNDSKQPTLVHCASGNRVGALMALNHYAKNGDLEQALQAGRDAGMTRLENRVIEVIGLKTAERLKD